MFTLKTYNPITDYHKLYNFMVDVFPYRSKTFINWWLTNQLHGQTDAYYVVHNKTDKIVACTSIRKFKIYTNGEIKVFGNEGNTIVSPEFRGQGIGKILYNILHNSSIDILTFGCTKQAFQIQKNLYNTYYILNPLNVYISLNKTFIKHIFGSKKKCFERSLMLDESYSAKQYKFTLVNCIDDLHIPQNGIWNNHLTELVRDRDFIYNRFFNYYGEQKYYIFQISSKTQNLTCGYFVIRTTSLRNINCISLVDYRVENKRILNIIMTTLHNIANNNIGVIISLSTDSYKYFITKRSFSLKIKEIICSSNTTKIDNSKKLLITSADSDLDFVYYK